MFSFNSPYGACEHCGGIGAHMEISPALIVPDERKSLRQGAIYPWAKTGNPYYQDILASVADHYLIDMDAPFESLSEEHKNVILYGSGGERVTLTHDEFQRRYRKSYPKQKFRGRYSVL